MRQASLALPALLALTIAAPARGDVRLPALLSSHMVVQQSTQVNLWGWAEPGEEVRVTVSWREAGAEPQMVRADGDGRWSLPVATPAAGGPHTITVRGKNEIVLSDVYSGEVWVCSGQSNMDWHVAKSEDPLATAASATDPLIRLFDVEDSITTAPSDDVVGTWQPCSPEAVTTFSAVAFHFGTRLREGLGDVPIGLISTNWGGTVAESWTSREGLRDFPEFVPELERIAQIEAGEDEESNLEERQAAWWANLEASDPGFAGQWMKDANGIWREARAPLTFADLDLGAFDGLLWMRREVTIDEAAAGQACLLDLGPIDDMDQVFWDGELVGATLEPGRWRRPRQYELSAEQTASGDHDLCVLAIDTGGVGSMGISQGEPYPMALASTAGEPLQSLDGDWLVRQGVELGELGSYPAASWLRANRPSMLFNGMIAPLVPYAIQGVIWYQGESNRTRAEQYRTLFPAMIRDWRSQWGRELPFYYVQIAPYGYTDDAGEAAELREAQAMALALPSTGMVVTMDVGNPENIHPAGKNVVGGRLGDLALKHTYGQEGLRANPPAFRDMAVEGGAVRLRFDNAPQGLATSDGEPPSHFTLAGADGVFHPAVAAIEADEVVVRCAEVPEPRAVRHAWGAADEPNLCDGMEPGLPVASFRSDG